MKAYKIRVMRINSIRGKVTKVYKEIENILNVIIKGRANSIF